MCSVACQLVLLLCSPPECHPTAQVKQEQGKGAANAALCLLVHSQAILLLVMGLTVITQLICQNKGSILSFCTATNPPAHCSARHYTD